MSSAPHWKNVSLMLFAVALLALPGCDLFGGRTEAFPWMEPGVRLVYDYRSTGEPLVESGNRYVDTDSAFVFSYVDPQYEKPRYKMSVPKWKFDVSSLAVPLLSGFFGFPRPQRAEDGLRLEYPESCEDADGYSSAILVPADPERGERYYHYRCGGRVKMKYVVTAVGQTVTVPAGTFENVFVLESEHPRPEFTNAGPEKQYWSEQEGLIQIEKFYKDGGKIGAYVLASKNF